ncbi:LAQU0S06e01816g1_1 [Lachancea quebecensis]|uniref:LAQU0S06e01816g1_1 n=1 Tax=Lachancea quebecensis TaxID=1654605 RepID=A0A0P1KS58_9SACH|nr:LAQU0S06e01816g1_1 [Lachancea quebecensis]
MSNQSEGDSSFETTEMGPGFTSQFILEGSGNSKPNSLPNAFLRKNLSLKQWKDPEEAEMDFNLYSLDRDVEPKPETYVSEIYEIKNVNPIVEEFVAEQMRVKDKPSRLLRFGFNQTKLFDAHSPLPNFDIRKPSEAGKPESILVVKDQEARYLEEDSHSDWDQDIPIDNPVVLEGFLRCWEACGIPEFEFDAEDMIMTVQKLSYGILQALANQGTVNRLVKVQQFSELTEDFEECWFDLLEALELEDTVKSMEASLAHQTSITAEKEKSIKFLEERLRDLERQLETQEELKQENRDLTAAVEHGAEMFQELNEKYRGVSLKLNVAEMNNDELSIKHNVLMNENTELRQELRTCRGTLKDRERQIKQLQRTMVNDSREAKKALEISKTQCNQMAFEYRNSEMAWKHRQSMLLSDLDDKSALAEAFSQELRSAKSEIESFRNQNIVSEASLNAAKEYIGELELQNRELNERLPKLSLQVEALLEFKSKAKARIVSLKDAKRDFKQQINKNARLITSLESRINELTTLSEAKENDNKELFQELQRCRELLKETEVLTPSALSPLKHKNIHNRRSLQLSDRRIGVF